MIEKLKRHGITVMRDVAGTTISVKGGISGRAAGRFPIGSWFSLAIFTLLVPTFMFAPAIPRAELVCEIPAV